MNADTFDACVQGYSARLTDLQILAVQSGYWSGYYGFGSKHPQSPDRIAMKILSSATPQQHADDVDVEEFLRKEASFQRRMMEGEFNGE